LDYNLKVKIINRVFAGGTFGSHIGYQQFPNTSCEVNGANDVLTKQALQLVVYFANRSWRD
jgi:hypothetical protein